MGNFNLLLIEIIPCYTQVVEIKESVYNQCEMEFNFNLVHVKHAAIDDSPATESSADSEVPRVYLRVQTLIEFDSFVSTHGPGTIVESGE